MNNLLRLIGRRLVAFPVMVLGVTFLVFFLMSLSPISPEAGLVSVDATPEMREKVRQEYGFDDPFFVQFGRYLWNLCHGDLGVYAPDKRPVIDAIGAALPITLQLTFLGLLIALVVSFPLGVLAAIYRDRWPDQVIRVISVICIGTPSFWLAVLLVMGFMDSSFFKVSIGKQLPGMFENFPLWFACMFLPAVTLAIPVIGQMTRVVRTSVVEELDRDYVRTALGAGIPKPIVIGRNVLRNALITPVTVLGLRVGYLMGGAVVIEIIFNINAMGKLLISGVNNSYTALVQGCALVVALAFIIVNIVVDILYLLINPRIRSV